MALALFGEAALGAVTSESLKALLDFTDNAINFGDKIKELEPIVNLMGQILRDIEELELPKEETKMITDRLEEAHELIRKCCKTQYWNFFKKASNSKKLKKMEGTLKVFPQYLQFRYYSKILAKVNRLTERGAPEVTTVGLDKMTEDGDPQVPDCTVGLDEITQDGAPEVTDCTAGLDDVTEASLVAAVVAELLSAVLDATNKAIKFRSKLETLESTLKSVQPLFAQLEKLNKVLDRPVQETKIFTDRLKNGKKLVYECSKIRWWNYCKKPIYAGKLMELDASILNFFQVEVQEQLSAESRKILVGVNKINAKLDGMLLDQRIPNFIVGLDVPLEKLKTKLLKDDDRVVVLSAPGGSGKTTLAKMLCNDGEIKEKFQENIFFVTVSVTPNLKNIVQRMFEHKNFPVPEFQNDDDAMDLLRKLLSHNEEGTSPKLLVLDDVWSGSEFLIEKFMFPIPEYKILVTSRFVFPRFDSTYKLELLNDQDAMDLFCHSAFPQGGSSNIPNDLVNEIVRGCRGFPLALTVVGGSLCGQPEVIWRRTLKQWSGGHSIFDSNSDLFNGLKHSIDALGEKTAAKECFLDLGLFPEDQRIAVTALMDMWVELYNLDEDGIEALANIHELASRNLANLVFTREDASGIDGYYNEHFVMQHDLLRDMAIYLSSQESIEQRKRLIVDIRENDLSKWSIEPMQPFHARLLSISTDEIFSSNWYNMLLPEKTLSSSWYSFSNIFKSSLYGESKQLPEVEVLILNFRTRNYGLPKFMEKMDQLKVLIITNYGSCPAELSNFQLLCLLSSLKRIRLEHVSISFLSESTLQLRNLRKISLNMCEIGETFTNSTFDFAHVFPNLVEIDIHCCSDLVELPERLYDIICLKKLSITKCNDLDALPQKLGRLTNLEVLRLHSCEEMLRLPESVGSLHKLRFLDISNCQSLRKLPKRIGELCGLEKLDMRGCGVHQLPESVKDLGQLKDVICDEDTVNLWEPFKIHLNNLKTTALKEDKI